MSRRREDHVTTRSSSRLLSLAGCVVSLPVLGYCAPAPAAPSEDIPALIRQLGDPDFRHREAATQRLKEIGKPAAPALREALGGGDPEVCARADSLLRQIERPR